MSEQPKEEVLDIIKEIESFPNLTQRTIAEKLGISLGKTNYLLAELVKKGFVKVKNFSTSRARFKGIVYNLTKKGFMEKVRLTQHFLQRKEEEYLKLKAEYERLCEINKEKEEVTNESKG